MDPLDALGIPRKKKLPEQVPGPTIIHPLPWNLIYTKKEVDALLATSGGAVSSVFGRAGAVTAQSGDYNAGQISGLGSLATLNSIDLTADVGSTILPIANGGTGSATQNFVDLTTTQTIAGNKTFTGTMGFGGTTFMEDDGGGGLWLGVTTNNVNVKISFGGGSGKLIFDQFGQGTVLSLSNNGIALNTASGASVESDWTPDGGSRNLGSTSSSWQNLYATILNLNSTASMSGATAGVIAVTGNLSLSAAGNKLSIATGTNASIGTGTLSGGTVTISTTAVTASSLIFLTDTSNGANLGTLSVGTKTAGTSFVVNSSNALDAGTFNYVIIN